MQTKPAQQQSARRLPPKQAGSGGLVHALTRPLAGRPGGHGWLRRPRWRGLPSGGMLAGLLILLASHPLAVNPLPPAIQDASPATQQAYLEQLGEESDQLRRQYAQQRYKERQRYCQDVAMAMFNEAEARREELLAQAPMPSGATSGPAPARAGAPALPSRARDLVLLGLAVALVCRFRKRLFRKFYA